MANQLRPTTPALTAHPVAPPDLEKLKQPLRPGDMHLGAAKEIVPTLREFGLDPDPLIREAGLAPDRFNDEMNVVRQAALGRLFSLCVAWTNCPHFGLLVGQRSTILSLGVVGRLMQHCETVGDALTALVSNLSLENREAVSSLTVRGDTAVLTFATYQPRAESVDQITDAAIAVFVNALRALRGFDWNPTEVLLPRAAPANQQPFWRHVRARVRFDEETAAIVFPACDLDRPIARADPLLRALLEEWVNALKGRAGSDFSDEVRRMLRTQLTRQHCLADDMAELLSVHRRTLSRRLKRDGTGYRGIRNETRFVIARQLLEDTEAPLIQIAAALGYSEASAFTRAFRRWSGEAPITWRRRHLAQRQGGRSGP